MADRLIADFEIEIEDVDFDILKNTLEKFRLDVAPNKIVNFLAIVCKEFVDNLTEDETHLIGFMIRRILTAAFECIRKTENDD